MSDTPHSPLGLPGGIGDVNLVHDDEGTGRPPEILKVSGGWIYYISAYGHGHARCRVRAGTTTADDTTWQLALPPGPQWYLPVERMRAEALAVAAGV